VSRLIPAYEAELTKHGADLFGKTGVECALTGGREVECLVKIPFRRLGRCGVAEGSVFVESTASGLQQSGRQGNGNLSGVQQICYIGPNGEPVPSRP
jgi:hypothetical protein